MSITSRYLAVSVELPRTARPFSKIYEEAGLKKPRYKYVNHYADNRITEMSRIVGAIMGNRFPTPEWASERKFAIMEVTERIMQLAEERSSDHLMNETLRGWIGKVQTAEGLQ